MLAADGRRGVEVGVVGQRVVGQDAVFRSMWVSYMAISEARIDVIEFDMVVSRIGSWSAAKPGSMPVA